MEGRRGPQAFHAPRTKHRIRASADQGSPHDRNGHSVPRGGDRTDGRRPITPDWLPNPSFPSRTGASPPAGKSAPD